MIRNKELGWLTGLVLTVSGVGTVVGFCIQPAAGVLCLCLSFVLCTIFLAFTRMRYRRIANLSEQIDLVLHDADLLFLQTCEEGELAILQSEITKMTRRIREQNYALQQEKCHLADALADIAHQLRTPLTSANLTLTLLKKNPAPTERMALLRETEQLFVQMDWLITALLKLSRLDAGIVPFAQQSIDLQALLDRVTQPFLISMDLHDISLDVVLPGPVALCGDADWLAEALRNIFKNCMESAGDHGAIQITCHDTLLFTELVFHDSGPGFSESDLPRLFDRFYRGQNTNTAGFGIGLALCKTILTRQGATITAKNHPTGGAMFCLRFPK